MATGQGRLHFQQELRALEEQALGGLDLVVSTLDRTLEALEHQDIELASIVVNDDDRIDGRYLEMAELELEPRIRERLRRDYIDGPGPDPYRPPGGSGAELAGDIARRALAGARRMTPADPSEVAHGEGHDRSPDDPDRRP